MIECILTLDYEVYGNGSGSLKDLVFEPGEQLRQIFRKWDARFVAFVEAAEFYQIEKGGTDPAIRDVRRQIHQFHQEGFEIGLHLHPHWCNARHENGKWVLDADEYNLCTLPRPRISEIVDLALNYLCDVVGDSGFTPLSFRAGNWLFQPTEVAASVLAEKGIRIDSSVFKGGLQHNHTLDYRPALRNGYYWSFSNDVNVPDAMGSCVEVPIYTEMVPFWKMSTSKRLAFTGGQGMGTRNVKQKVNRARDLMRFLYPRKLDFCRMTLDELTTTLEAIVREDQRSPEEYKPIVAIGHSKDLVDPSTVDAFLAFLRANKIRIGTFETACPKLTLDRTKAIAAVRNDEESRVRCQLRDVRAEDGTGRTASLKYVLITPARNEAMFIEKTIQSMIAQTSRPLRWVIVSDGSTDGTDEIVKKYTAEHPWIELIRMPERSERHFAGKVHAFNAGRARIAEYEDCRYDLIGNLDADITFDEDYYDFLLKKFAMNPQLGVAGTPFREEGLQYDYRFTRVEHVSGACQLFRRQCFEQIGGYLPLKSGGVDLVAVTTARMRGWQTRAFLEKHCHHHRKMSSAKHSPLRGAFFGGKIDFVLGCDPVWQFLRSIYRLKTYRPVVLNGVLCLAGYLWAAINRTEKVVPEDFVRFRRREERERLREIFWNAVRWRRNKVSGPHRETPMQIPEG
jgi:glycosyltransferase involved in cell wall biosynthesis